MATMVRVDEKLHATLRKLSEEEHRPIGQVIAEAVDRYQREKFWQEVEASLDRLRADPGAWKDYQDEIALFEGASMDGLEDEEPYYTPEEEAEIREHRTRTYGG